MKYITSVPHIAALLQRSQQPYRQGHRLMSRLAALAAMILFVFSSSVNAASFTLVGAPATVEVGESFDIQVVGDFPSDDFLLGGVIFEFDPSKVSVDTVVNNIPLGVAPGFTDPFFTCPSACVGANDPSNSIELAWGSLFGISLMNTQMATITLIALDKGAASFGLFENQFNLLVSSVTFAPLAGVQFSGADVQIIPVPAAIWLFGSGLLGLAGMARRHA